MDLKRFKLFTILFLLAFPSILGAQANGDGLKGTYYTNDNLTSEAVSEVDPWLSYLWDGCPAQPNMSVSIFSVQWTGLVEPSYSEPYTFIVFVAGGVSVIVNGQTVINQWTDSANTSYQGSIALSANVKYPLVVDYFTDGANPTTDHIQLAWQSPSQAQETIPRQYLFSGAPLNPTPTPQASLACQAASASISVNGLLAEWAWPRAGWNSVNRAGSGNSYGTTASFKTLWDSANLYLGVTVTDSVLTGTGTSNIYNYSTVEIYLDTSDSRSVTTNSSDYEYFFGWNDTTPQESQGRTSGVSMKTTTIPSGYVVEASIPWSTLGMASPSPGTALGLDLGVDVNHNGGNCRDGEIFWNGGRDDYANASSYGQLTLTGACPTPVATPPIPINQPYVYANPTSGPVVTFVYSMAQSGKAAIKVWNAWGNLAATINDAKSAGLASSTLDISSFAPGHYFYRIELDYDSGQKDAYKTQVLAVKK
jgi:hypothetical protein